MKNRAPIFCISLFLFGCSTYFEDVVYRPAPATYQEWSKSGASTLDIKKSLLECGKPAPDTNFEIYERAFNISRYDEISYMNKIQLEDICMESAGYIYSGAYSTKKICLQEKYSHLPACQLGVVKIKPSVERRLNSWYCKVKSDYQYCLAHALAPKLCSREKADHPPPECLPPGEEYKAALINQPNQHSYTESYAPIRDFPERSLQLQQEIQGDSNRQMDKLLHDTAPRIHR
ncbi:MAG TPA: hypothetical protein VFX01_06595 [Methylophilaceae bacterium]|nr:hypothetical protein [Methylophilaceae bacterium]